jgi:1-acyl-sn-glycerol-3-phosphate acyltransferase
MSTAVPGFPAKFPVRDDDRRPKRYKIASWGLRVFLRSAFGRRRLLIEGEELIPDAGPLVVASNHLSNVDPLLYGGYFRRTLFAMAKRELFPNRVLAWMWGGCNVFPIDRSGPDRRALKISFDILARGGRLLMFVEGTRARTAGMTRAQPGVGFLVRRSPGVTIVPAALWGTEKALEGGLRALRRRDLHLRYGAPFTVDIPSAGKPDDQATADDIARHIAELLPEEYRGVYA